MRPGECVAPLSMTLNILPFPRLSAFQSNSLTPVVLKWGKHQHRIESCHKYKFQDTPPGLLSLNLCKRACNLREVYLPDARSIAQDKEIILEALWRQRKIWKHSNIPGKKPAYDFICEALFSEQKRSINSKGDERAQTHRKKGETGTVWDRGLDESTLANLCFVSSNKSCSGLVPQSSSLAMGGENSAQ